MNTSSPQTTHLQAESAREHEKDFTKALSLIDASFDSYLQSGDIYGAAEALCSRVLTLRHCADQHPEQPTYRTAYLTQALHTALASVEIATKHTVSTAIPYQNLGKIQQLLGQHDNAVQSFQKALEAQQNNPHPTQNRPGVLANFQELLASAQLSLGDTSALQRAEDALRDLEASDEDDYNKAVWLLNGHARIARACRTFDVETARKHYQAAKTLLASRNDLELSQKTLDDLTDLA